MEFTERAVLFFRFGAALLLIVAVALAGTALEAQNLALKRSLSQQQYRMEVLVEQQSRLRLETQRLGAPARLLQNLQQQDSALYRPAKPQRIDQRRAPLLNWSVPDPSARPPRPRSQHKLPGRS